MPVLTRTLGRGNSQNTVEPERERAIAWLPPFAQYSALNEDSTGWSTGRRENQTTTQVQMRTVFTGMDQFILKDENKNDCDSANDNWQSWSWYHWERFQLQLATTLSDLCTRKVLEACALKVLALCSSRYYPLFKSLYCLDTITACPWSDSTEQQGATLRWWNIMFGIEIVVFAWKQHTSGSSRASWLHFTVHVSAFFFISLYQPHVSTFPTSL